MTKLRDWLDRRLPNLCTLLMAIGVLPKEDGRG